MSRKTIAGAKQRLIRNRWWVLAVLAVIAVVSFGVYKDSSAKADKEKFEKAQASIDALYADIVAKVGEPNNYRRGQSCGRPNIKGGQGDLSCDVGVDFVYAVQGREEADKVFTQIYTSTLDRKDLLSQKSIPETKLTERMIVSSISTSAYNEYKAVTGGLTCIVKSVYDTPDSTYLVLQGAEGKKNLYTSIGCYGAADREYYPVQK